MSIKDMDYAEAEVRVLADTIQSAGKKLKVAMDGGPDSPDVVLTPEEATIVYRLLKEQLGVVL